MRLVCPNCGAQYEVDDRVIPESGRDVQCSACGHAWYQMSRDRPAAVEPPAEDALGPGDWEPEEEGDDEAATAADATPEPEPELAAAPEPAPDFEAEPEPDLDDEPEPEPEPAEPPQPAPARRPLDEGVAGILQEEARHEIERRGKERSHEPEPVETQPDLGLDAATSPDEERRRIARERMARMRGLEEAEDEDSDGLEPPQAPTPEPTPAADDAPEEPAEPAVAESLSGMRRPEGDMPRRELFPDIEEINSTLDSRDAQAEAGEDARERRSGFARGFFLVVLIALIAVIVYILAPRLSDTIPALKPALSRYVAWVNEGRVWLDTTLQGVIAKIEAAAKSGQ